MSAITPPPRHWPEEAQEALAENRADDREWAPAWESDERMDRAADRHEAWVRGQG